MPTGAALRDSARPNPVRSRTPRGMAFANGRAMRAPLAAIFGSFLATTASPPPVWSATPPALHLDRGRIAVTSATTRVRLHGRCTLPREALAGPVEVGLDATVFRGGPPQFGAAGHATATLVASDGGRGRLMLRRKGAVVAFRLAVETPAAMPPALAVALRIGGMGCERTLRFQPMRTRKDDARFPWRAPGDADGDGARSNDCAPRDPAIHPGAVDLCGNGLDEDCDGGDARCDFPLFPGLRVSEADQSFAGDLNVDGVTDLVYTTYRDIHILLGRGDAGFVHRPSIIDDYFGARAIADVDGDGLPDIIAVRDGPAGLTVYFGDGDGGVTETRRLPIGPFPFDAAVADVDRDGHGDLVVTNMSSTGEDQSVVSVVRGLGSRTFGPAVETPIAAFGLEVATGDVNGDGAPDVATVSGTGVAQILISAGAGGNGALTPGQVIATESPGSSWHGIVLGRFDEDAIVDLAISGFERVATFRGVGNGTFTTGPAYVAGGFAGALASGDLDRDGALDLVVGGRGEILRGDGRGGFTVEPPFGTHGVGAAIGKFTVGPDLDALSSGYVFPARNTPARTAVVPFEIRALRVGDLDGDLHPDFVAAGGNEVDSDEGNETARILILRGSPGGQPIPGQEIILPAPPRGPGGQFTALAVADFDGDERADILAARPFDRAIYAYRGIGDATFVPAGLVSITSGAMAGLGWGDLDGDGDHDLVVAFRHPREALILLGDGAGGFAAGGQIPAGRDVTSSANAFAPINVADLDADGHLDLLVGCGESAEVAVLRGLGGAEFAPQVLYPTGGETAAVAAGDLDGDGRRDFAVATFDGTVRTFLNQGSAAFAVGVDVPLQRWLTSLVVADVDRDGRQDLVASGIDAEEIWLVRGVFAHPQRFAAAAAWALAVGDVDGDAMPDLVSGSFGLLRVLPQTSIPPLP